MLMMRLGDVLPPGQSTERMLVELKKGDYLLLDDSDPNMRQTATFKVTTISNTVAPKADVVVNMQDFAFGMPDQIKAGKLIWQLNNPGKQWHALVIAKVQPGATLEDVLKALGDPSGPSPTPDPNVKPKAQIVGGLPPISEGERTWIELDLQPGTYMLICPVPDLAMMGGQGEPITHIQHGMLKTLVVK